MNRLPVTVLSGFLGAGNTTLLNEVLRDRAEASAGWIRELEGEHTPETEEYGIASFTYRTASPFDAERLRAFMHDERNWQGMLRSKGFFWVAADHRICYEWAQAGGVSTVNAIGMWWAALPREYWDHPPGERPDEEPDWHPRYGDRRQTLVFIGQGIDEPALRAHLDECLLDEAVAARDSASWLDRPNPFPPLRMVEGAGA